MVRLISAIVFSFGVANASRLRSRALQDVAPMKIIHSEEGYKILHDAGGYAIVQDEVARSVAPSKIIHSVEPSKAIHDDDLDKSVHRAELDTIMHGIESKAMRSIVAPFKIIHSVDDGDLRSVGLGLQKIIHSVEPIDDVKPSESSKFLNSVQPLKIIHGVDPSKIIHKVESDKIIRDAGEKDMIIMPSKIIH